MHDEVLGSGCCEPCVLVLQGTKVEWINCFDELLIERSIHVEVFAPDSEVFLVFSCDDIDGLCVGFTCWNGWSGSWIFRYDKWCC